MRHWAEELRRSATQRRVLRMPPTAVLALLFLSLIVVGAALLLTPYATKQPLRVVDALFTATSAVTVTGLGVVDTGAHFTRFGQIVILVLIQLGGLGMITFTVMVLALLGQRLGIRQQMLLKEDLNQTSLGDLVRLVHVIAIVVFVAEAAGAALLTWRFVPLFGWSEGVFHAVFHSVSAFNNAGFALFPDSMTRFAVEPWVSGTLAALIVVGGIGYSVLDELWNRRKRSRLSLHTRLTLIGTGLLLVWTFASFAVLEWHNPKTLGLHPTTSERLVVSMFQAVSVRTAGFNSVDMGALSDGSTLVFLTMMFIGGGSTSTAGGIKVSSFMVLCIATTAFVRGSTTPNAFGRTIAAVDILKVLALVFVSMFFVITGAFLLTLTTLRPVAFIDVLFEAVSAFGTVGLSRGITAQFDDFGRGILMVLMYVGRIGPLALGFAFARRGVAEIRFPQGRVYLG